MRTLIRRVLTVLALLTGMMWAFQFLFTKDFRADDAQGDVAPAEGPAPQPAGKASTGPRPASARAEAPPPTRPALIREVLEANIPMPTRSKVALPGFPYERAFPGATDAPEIVVTSYDEAPMLRYYRDPNAPPAGASREELARWQKWRDCYPKDLPPVEQRLPENPAVVVGPDSPGIYGGVWRRCTAGRFDFYTKLCTESFMKHDPSGNLQPCLAYKWEASPDNRVYTMYLRKGHKWSDGRPFTTEDILWVCNVNIGSGGFDPPDWMQARDGAALLYEDDCPDWRALARRIVQEADAPPSVGGQIKAHGSARLWKNLRALASGEGAEKQAATLAAADLNDLFRDGNFYDEAAFARVDANAELRELQAAGASRLDANGLTRMLLLLERNEALRKARSREANALTPMDISRMNLLLFRTAYREQVAAATKDRVKVEAVDDGTGDTSHIVRFTFRKPNSLFLEHTPTFMFYRILGQAKHALAPLHPLGRTDLSPEDIFDWEGLFRTVRAQAQAPAPSPGKQVWAGLGEAIRQRIQNDPPKGTSPADYKRELVAALNRALAGRGFYDPAAWGDFDPDALIERLHWNKEEKRSMDTIETFRDESRMVEYGDWLVVKDLLARWRSEGAASLDDAETLRLNVALFRAAYSADANRVLVARTRTEGLNQASFDHPLKYSSWSARMNDAGQYHPEYNPNPPVLTAWRIVSEKDAPEMVAVRNPYYYKVDAQGRQLPYIDAVQTSISSQKQIRILKMTSGNVDMQGREIMFDEFTVLKQNEKKGDYEIRLWANDYCGEVTFMPLQSHKDPQYARLNEDPNFRYALSLALNRRELIDVVFAGMGEPAQFSIPRGSKYYSESMATQCVEFDPKKANRLLDAMGLDKRGPDGKRLFWDGSRFLMDVNTPTAEMPETAVRLACQYWQDIGVDAQMKIRTGNMMYRLEEMGASDVRVHKEGGNYFGPFPPGSYYPSHEAESVQWYQWTKYMRSGGRQGWPAPERIKELERLWQAMVEAPDEAAKMAGWKAITDRFARDLPIIGVMTSPGKIIYVRKGFMNVPKIALAGWIAHEPGNACPEIFYFGPRYGHPELEGK